MNQAERYETEEKVEFEVYGKNRVYYAVLKNLSKTGAFLEMKNTGRLPENGTLLNVRFKLDRIRKTHQLDAQIKWQNNRGVGIQFVRKTEVLERMFRRVTF